MILTGPLPISRYSNYMHRPDRSHTLNCHFQHLSPSPHLARLDP